MNKSSAVRRLFGTDGVRGIANRDLSPFLAMSLGAAAAQVLRHAAGSRCEVVVGRDPRISGDLLEAALIAGLCSQGVDVATLGVVPTPGVACMTRARQAAAGIVVSASHNPVQDNGIKFFGADGCKLSDDLEAEIEAALPDWESVPRPIGSEVGRCRSIADHTPYSDSLKTTVGDALRGLKVVLDCAQGAASPIAPRLLRELGVEVIALSAEPDGININENCGSLHPEALASRVVAENADAGLAFDGDADRVILADETGQIFDGDRILCAVGLHLHRQNRLRNAVVVGTVMSNLGLEKALEAQGIRLVRAAVGDRYVAEQMVAYNAVLGGEKSGHILFPELTTTGDGILTGLQVLKLCRESGRRLSSWSAEMEEYPQKLVSIPVTTRDGWEQDALIQDAISIAAARLGDRGRINVRPSGTEAKIRVMVEGPDAAEVATLVELVAQAVRTSRGA